MKNAKQIVLLGSNDAKRKGGNGTSFLAHEIKIIIEAGLPVVIANLDGNRKVNKAFIPQPLLDANYYTVSVSFQPKIIKYALDGYAVNFDNVSKSGPYLYPESVYIDTEAN